MSQPLDFQSMMIALQEFWADRGCLIWQPYHTEVGAGTMNPATFLRVLGPEPWNVAYVEPSIRTDDGRYGENPYRMLQHYQFQVILKPDPGNPQDLYLDSLRALGIQPEQHDIRFVEDNWEQPALGAWGLGWEVWLDGQEITQFTYFQQAGGFLLDPVSVEITYGLERIAMPLQRVHDFKDIRWNQSFTYGDVNLHAEREHSLYNFEVADVQRLQQVYDHFEAEARASVERGLVLPAHDFVLKCSQVFNILDTRGAIGVTERQAYFGRMRNLARQVSEAYLAQRQALEYPWLDRDVKILGAVKGGAGENSQDAAHRAAESADPAPFLLEIGTEELPSADLEAAMAQLRDRIPALLDGQRLPYGEARVMGTPRRLVVHVTDLAQRQTDLEQVVKGPPAERAFDEAGNPTSAASGFARSRGVDVAELEIHEIEGGRYVMAAVREAGRPTIDVLSENLPELIAALRFEKSMRWDQTNVAFSRPIRWLLALHGDRVVPLTYAGLQAGASTRGLRVIEPQTIPVKTPAEYFQALEEQRILLDTDARQRWIKQNFESLAAEFGGNVPDDPALLTIVANEVEAPSVLIGNFEEAYLDLPRQLLIAVMKKHQHYFPVEKAGKLLPSFVAVRNGDGRGHDLVVRGNEDVIGARFADASFFVAEDKKQPLEAHLEKLGTLTFQKDLGSMLDKSHRITQLVQDLAIPLHLDAETTSIATRAAALCKADLVTKMVVEMTSLQGVMGRYYALHSGEPEEVANAIFEHYLPRFAGDALPEALPGLVVGLADRLDTLAGLFAAGLAPTGAKDPFAQRRAALAIVSNLTAADLDLDLRVALQASASHLPVEVQEKDLEACLEFIVERLRNQLLEEGFRYDVVDAVLAAQGHNPARARRAVGQLNRWVIRDDWQTILPAYARCVRITRDLKARFKVQPDRFVEASTRALYGALVEAENAAHEPGSVDDFLITFNPLIPVINRFFDDVLVMDEDQKLRENRLGLLQRIAGLADGVADLSRLEGF